MQILRYVGSLIRQDLMVKEIDSLPDGPFISSYRVHIELYTLL